MSGQGTAAAGDAPAAVTILGPESTGKSTLAARLAERLDTAWSPEAARAYVDRRLAAGMAAALGPAHVAHIAVAQVDLEEAAAARATGRPVVLRDTDLVSTVVYARHYYGAAPDWLLAAARARRAALYLLCDVDVPWVADAQRDRPQARGALYAAFTATLAELGCRVRPLQGGWAARETTALRAIEALRGA